MIQKISPPPPTNQDSKKNDPLDADERADNEVCFDEGVWGAGVFWIVFHGVEVRMILTHRGKASTVCHRECRDDTSTT